MSTLKDLSKETGYTVMTISRVINSPDKVKPKTREKIVAAMEKLKYSPNPVAKALVEKRSGIIDVYVPYSIDLSNPFVMHLVTGISESLSRYMYSFHIRRDRALEHTCDGYIVTGLLRNELHEMYEYANERGRPLVLFGHTELPDINCIDVDNIAGAKEATFLLLKHGHKRIAMINVDEQKDYTIDRFVGYREALEADGEAVDESIVIYATNSVQGGYIAAQKLLRDKTFSALFCATDTIALGAIRALTEAGIKVPDDISVVGFDGLGHHLLTYPHITTVQQPVFEIGKMLADTLVNRISGKSAPVKLLIKPDILIQDSVRL